MRYQRLAVRESALVFLTKIYGHLLRFECENVGRSFESLRPLVLQILISY